jgi:hypothetical protein
MAKVPYRRRLPQHRQGKISTYFEWEYVLILLKIPAVFESVGALAEKTRPSWDKKMAAANLPQPSSPRSSGIVPNWGNSPRFTRPSLF